MNNSKNKELSARMIELAEQIKKLPSTGMIETERVIAILGEYASITLETLTQSNNQIRFTNRVLTSWEKLHWENKSLREQNNALAWDVAGAIGVEGNA